jgi:uncharacterized protein (DUF58 family)
MPRERLDKPTTKQYPLGVYVDLQTLIKLQHEIRGFSLLPSQPVQSLLTGKHRSKLRGRGLDFEEVRAYEHGDDIRNIDWKVTARVRKPHTKVYTEERERPVFIIIDQTVSMFFGSVKKLKSVTAAHAAALAAWKVLAVGDRIGGIVFNDTDFIEVTPKRDRRAVQRFLQRIVEKNQQLSIDAYKDQNSSMLNTVLRKTMNLVSHDYLLVVISDFAGFNPDTMKHLILLSRHNDVILLSIMDEMEARLPAGEMVISNGDLQVPVRAGDEELRNQFSVAHAERLENLRDQVKSYGMTLLELNTTDPVSDQIRSMLSVGKKRMR